MSSMLEENLPAYIKHKTALCEVSFCLMRIILFHACNRYKTDNDPSNRGLTVQDHVQYARVKSQISMEIKKGQTHSSAQILNVGHRQ